MKPRTIDLTGMSGRLLSAIGERAARIRIGFPFWLAPFMARNVLAITLGRRIYLSRHLMETGRERLEATLRHELEHVRQVQQHGFIRFLCIYLRDYVQLRRQGLSSAVAYAAIPFEIEAKEAEDVGFPEGSTYNQSGE